MKKMLVVSHDAGGAEIIAAWIKRNSGYEYTYLLEGPAIQIFTRKIPAIRYQGRDDLLQVILSCDVVLTGTSWGSTLENEAIHLALENHIKVMSYLESWRNYTERFFYNGVPELPDEIWVGDQEAQQIAISEFPGDKVKLVPNCYFLDMKTEIANIQVPQRSSDKIQILYLCEPIAKGALWRFGDEHYLGYTEHSALAYFFSCLDKYWSPEEIAQIVIRPHPADEAGKYDAIIQQYQHYPVTISQNRTLAYDCAASDYVVGCSSVALVVCLLAGKNVFTCIPVENSIVALPHQAIRAFHEYAEKRCTTFKTQRDSHSIKASS